MKKLLILFGIALLFCACKTTEENYRQSYESAVAKIKDKEREGVDSATYNRIVAMQAPKGTIVGNDTVKIVTGLAWQAYGEDIKLKKYNVVVGAMKQIFNAKEMCNRLRNAGCEAYVMTDRHKNYYVVAAAYNRKDSAADFLKNISTHIPFKLPLSEPYIYDTTKIYVKNE